jgi:hypothetical protein
LWGLLNRAILSIFRPTQHGQDFVGLISTIINENAHQNSKVNAVLVCFCLESLQALVAAEVREKCFNNLTLSRLAGGGGGGAQSAHADFGWS